MRFPNHVSVVWDLTALADYVPVLMGMHDHLLILPPPAPPQYVAIAPSVEQAAPIAWPGGLVGGKHKLTDTVYHNHVWIAQKGHDLGMGLTHISIPPNDILIPIHILQSSRKASFGAGEVKADKKPIACCTMFDLGVLPTPMTVCGKVPLPIAGTGTAVWGNSLIVGQHLMDWIMGFAEVVIRAVLGYTGARGSSMNAEQLEAIFSDPLGSDDGDADWTGLVVAGLGVLGQEAFDYHGDVEWGHGGVNVERGGEDGTVTVSAERTRSLGVGEVTGRGEVRYHPDGHGGWTTDGGVSGGVQSLGRSRGGEWSTDRGARRTSEDGGTNSPLSEGTSWGDLPLI